MKAFKELGITKTLRVVFYTIILSFFPVFLFPPVRVFFLRLLGIPIGRDTIVHDIKLFNWYHKGLKALRIGNYCFLGNEVMLDLADEIVLEDHVTLSNRALVISHTNVGYKDHPLQRYFPKFSKRVLFKKGSFVGAGAIIMPGVTVGEGAVIGAGAVVLKDVPHWSVVAGVPARIIRKIKK